MKCIFSVDVEDWFHILDLPSTPEIAEWSALPSRVERNFQTLLDIFSASGVSTTCFFLGWIAQRFPGLVREAHRRGHEIASHGFAHRLAYQMTPQEFRADAAASKQILEDIAGCPVFGYRGAGFSVTERTPWFFEELINEGYRYDSSVFPVPRGHGGIDNGRFSPYRVVGSSGELVEFPITVAKVLKKRVCFSGGGYLRLFPIFLIEAMTRRVLNEGRPVVFYIHPREIDPSQPRLPMSLQRRAKSYVNLKTTKAKVERLLANFEITSFQNYLAEYCAANALADAEGLGRVNARETAGTAAG